MEKAAGGYTGCRDAREPHATRDRGEEFFAFFANPNNPSGFAVDKAHSRSALDTHREEVI